MLLSERFVVLTIFGAHLLGFLQLCECEKCGSDQPKCPNNLCCSTYGYCGSTNEHCTSGCQPQYGHCHPSSVNTSTEAHSRDTDQDCGPKVKRSCPNQLCCSTGGYCGDEEGHCITFCNSHYGHCHPFRVNASIGFPSKGNLCGVENDNRYCPDKLCCSEHGYCGNDIENNINLHCDDGCQRYFGHCNEIANCSLPSSNYNIFPPIPIKQRALSSREKNFWYLFCKPGSILKTISQPQPITCNKDDGTWPNNLLPECDENVVYKSMETLSEIVDGNLLTCRPFPKEIVQKIPIESTHSKIQDIRITTHKTSLYVFNVSVVDIDKTLNNETTHWEKTFNDTIEYGKAVIFLSNLTINLITGSKRFIRLKPLVDLSICEVEVSSFPSGQDESYIKWIAIATSSVIFFLLVILILVVVCFQYHFKNKNSATDKEHHSNSKNEYSLTDHQRAPRPPGFGFSNPGHSSFNGSEDRADYYEEINYPFLSPLPQLNSNSASDLLGQGVYDEAVSLGKVLNKPRFAPPSVPQFPTNF